MVIEFIYRHVKLPLPLVLNAPESYEERPWFISLLETMSDNEKSSSGQKIVKALGDIIFDEKKFSQECRLIWLCGPWLESDDRIEVCRFFIMFSRLF